MIQTEQVVAALFDMDGVLVDTNPYHKLAFKQFLQQHNISLTDEELKTNVYGRTNVEIMPFIFKHEYTAEQSEKWADEKEAIFRELYKNDIQPVKGVVTFLQQLTSYGIKTAVGTSAPKANLDFIIDEIKIRQYFDALLHSADVKQGKPHPEIYLNAANSLGIEPRFCIVFEDSLAGIRAGLHAGMKVVAITTTHTRHELAEADVVIDDFSQFSVHEMLQLLHGPSSNN